MHLKTNSQHPILSFLFRYPVVKIIILLVLHILGGLLFAIIIFTVVEYVLGQFGFILGQTMGGLWISIKLNFLPPIIFTLSLLVILVSNPIHALIALILVFFSTALFLISIQVEFLALIYIIVYIGAIAILFLFVIMMFNLKELRSSAAIIHQNNNFLVLALLPYLLTLYKFYYLLINEILNYIEYDSYFNKVIILKYNTLFGSTHKVYITFVQDIIDVLKKDLDRWYLINIDPYNIGERAGTKHILLNEYSFDITPPIYKWYLESADNLLNINSNFVGQTDSSIKQQIEDIIFFLSTIYTPPIDILIGGQVLYTYYSYLFLLSTLILLVSMVGAIILALSTTEKN